MTTIEGLQTLLTSGGINDENVGGPIAVIKTGAEIAETNGANLLVFMAALSGILFY